MSDSSWEFLKIENERIRTAQKILMDKKLPETTNLCRNNEKLGGKQRGNLVTRYKFEFAVWLKRDAYLTSLMSK